MSKSDHFGRKKMVCTFTQLNCWRDQYPFLFFFIFIFGFLKGIIFSTNCRQLCVYPKGYGQDKDISLSLYLRSADDLYTLPSVYVEFNLRVVDRAFNLHHIKRTGTYFCIFLIINLLSHWSHLENLYKFDFLFSGKHWFLSSDNTFGWSDFMPLRTLNDPSKGFLRDDILSVEVQMLVKHGS